MATPGQLFLIACLVASQVLGGLIHYMLSNDDLDMLHVNEEAKEEAKALYAAHPGSNRMPDILPNNCVSDRWAILEAAAI